MPVNQSTAIREMCRRVHAFPELSKLFLLRRKDENFKTKRSGDERVRKRMITACFQKIPFKTAATSFAAVFITVKMSAIVFLSKTLHSLSQKRVSTLALFRQ